MTQRENNVKRVFTMLLTGLLSTGFGATQAIAASPHFVGTQSCTKNLSTGLTCSGKAAGLGSVPTVAFLTADEVDETFVCVNPGGNVAPGQPIVVQKVTGPSQTITPHNGQITYTVTIPPPETPPAGEVCPNGRWTVHPTSLTFKNVVAHIQQSGTEVLTFNFGNVDP